MKATNWARSGLARATATVLCIVLDSGAARAVSTVFFNSSRTTNLVNTNATTDTVSSEAYLFTWTMP